MSQQVTDAKRVVRELRPVFRAAREQGWVITLTGGGHMCWWSPVTDVQVFTGSTPGDARAVKNHLAKLRREGLRY